MASVLVLAIDTSTPDLVVGVVRRQSDGALHTLGEIIHRDTRHHNELLTPSTQQVLKEAGVSFGDLEAIVVGCGPGPFTGLRVGMASAQAFGQALGIPTFGVCSHDAILHAADCAEATQAGLVVTDARRREVYYSAYEQGVRTVGPEIIAPQQLDLAVVAPVIPQGIIAPEALYAQLPEWAHGAEICCCTAVPQAASLVAVADLQATPRPLEPLYLRRPDAKEPAPKPKSPAIPEIDITQ